MVVVWPGWRPSVAAQGGYIKIVDVKPIQVVEQPDFNNDGNDDLVLGKPTVVRVKTEIPNPPKLLPSEPINTRLSFGDVMMNDTRTLQQVEDNQFMVDFYLTPQAPGKDIIVKAVIDAFDIVGIEKKVTVKPTQSLHIAYVPISCYDPPLASYNITVARAGLFLAAQFPIASLTSHRLDVTLPCSAVNRNRLWQLGKKMSPMADRVVGITDDTWMDKDPNGGPGTNGFAWCGSNTAFVRDGHWDTVAHEIGHTYELNHPWSSKCNIRPSGIDLADGFWVETQQPIPVGKSLMDYPSNRPVFPQPNRWIARDDYERIFANFTTDMNDPEVLLVSGTIHKDGRLDWSSFYSLASGIIDDAWPGMYAIQVLDSLGKTLYKRSFDLKFVVLSETEKEIDYEDFGFAVPYSKEAIAVQVQYNGRVLARVLVTTKLLRDAVNLIPDAGFIRNPSQLRAALQDMNSALEHQLTFGDLGGARANLRNNIRVQLNQWLLNNYQTQSALQYTKAEILSLVDEQLQRLGG
jgi:hypothetical protein